jgi:hypothetical protein
MLSVFFLEFQVLVNLEVEGKGPGFLGQPVIGVGGRK